MSQEIRDVCIKAQSVKDNLQEVDNKYSTIFYSDSPETVNVNIKDNSTGDITVYTVDNFKKIEDDTNTFTDVLYRKQQFKALVNGVLIVDEFQEKPFFIQDVVFVDNTKTISDTAIKINDGLYNDSVLILKSL